MVSFESTSYSKRLLHLISWGHWFTLFNVFLAIILSSFYVFGEKTPDTLIGHFYLYTTWASHMGFLTFMSFVLVIFPIILIYPRTQVIRGTASVIFTSGLFLLLLDAFVYSRLGYHLNASSSDQIILLISNMIAHNSLKFWLICFSSILLILGIELTLSNYAWKHLKSLQRVVVGKYIVHVLVAAFFASHLTHIWADAKWNYDVLKQDTVLPLSYPSTAKTLLTKYELIDKDNDLENKENALLLTQKVAEYPVLSQQCHTDNTLNQSVFMILTELPFTENKIKSLSLKSEASNTNLTRHIDNALLENSWFNLFYSLPSLYKEEIIKQAQPPLLFQETKLKNIPTHFTLVSKNTGASSMFWFTAWFDHVTKLSDVSSLIFGENNKAFTEKLNQSPAGLHVFYFDENHTTQAELFIDALLLAQHQKQNKDIVWISSVGNKNVQESLSIKPSLLVVPNTHNNKLKRLTSHMDIQPTLLSQWLGCTSLANQITNGQDILTVKSNRVIANTIESGIMVFNKDKSVFIDKDGEFQSYSRQLKTPITVKPDFPLMIDGVTFIKRFNQQAQSN